MRRSFGYVIALVLLILLVVTFFGMKSTYDELTKVRLEATAANSMVVESKKEAQDAQAKANVLKTQVARTEVQQTTPVPATTAMPASAATVVSTMAPKAVVIAPSVGSASPTLFDAQSTGRGVGFSYNIGVNDGQHGLVFGYQITWAGKSLGGPEKGCAFVELKPGWYPDFYILDGRYEIRTLPVVKVDFWKQKLTVDGLAEQGVHYGCKAGTPYDQIPKWESKSPSPPTSGAAPSQPSTSKGERRVTGQNQTLRFNVGEAVYGWEISQDDGRKCTGGECYTPAATSAGTVKSGVINPWDTEVPGAGKTKPVAGARAPIKLAMAGGAFELSRLLNATYGERRATGEGGELAFEWGEAVFGWEIRLNNALICTGGGCYLPSAFDAGVVKSGVVNPWPEEIPAVVNSNFRCYCPCVQPTTQAPTTRDRRETGQNNTLTFYPGDYAYGWRIELDNGQRCDGGNCYISSSPVGGRVTSGVINPWPGEVPSNTRNPR